MKTTEVYYVVRYLHPQMNLWQRLIFADGKDRTESEDEADKGLVAFESNGIEAIRSKYTVTREDSTDDPHVEIKARLRGIAWVTSRTSKTHTCWGCKQFKVVFKTYNGGQVLPYWVCHSCARIAQLPID